MDTELQLAGVGPFPDTPVHLSHLPRFNSGVRVTGVHDEHLQIDRRGGVHVGLGRLHSEGDLSSR